MEKKTADNGRRKNPSALESTVHDNTIHRLSHALDQQPGSGHSR